MPGTFAVERVLESACGCRPLYFTQRVSGRSSAVYGNYEIFSSLDENDILEDYCEKTGLMPARPETCHHK